jgi:glycosyltransferase 2 family protein
METQQIAKPITFKNLFTETSRMKRLIKLFSGGFGLILLTWLLSQLEWDETIATLRTVPPSFLLIGLLCYILSFYLRALRFRLLLPPEYPRNHLFPIVLVHYTALNIIPARLGELSYIYLLNKVNQIPVGVSLSSLLLARVFDQLAIAVLFLSSLAVVSIASPWFKTLIWLVGGILLSTIIVLFVLLRYKERAAQWLKYILQRIRWDHFHLMAQMLKVLDEIVSALDHIHLFRQGWQLVGLSVGIWLSIFSVNYFLLRAFHGTLSYGEIMLTSTCIILLSALPFQILSGFGIHETTFVMLAGAFGVARNTAITAAISSHVLATVYLCLLGGYGLLRLQPLLKTSPTPIQLPTHAPTS